MSARPEATLVDSLAKIERAVGVTITVDLLAGEHAHFVMVAENTDRGGAWTPSSRWLILKADELRAIGEALLKGARGLERRGVLRPPCSDELDLVVK